MKKELIGKFDEVAAEIKDSEMEISTLQEKTRQVQESLPGLQENIQKTEQEKTKALDDFCLDKSNQNTVDLKAESYDQAMRKEKSAREILEVLGQKEIAAQKRLHRLSEQRARVESQIWNALYEEIFEDTRASIEKQLYKVFAVNARRSNSMIWENFLFWVIKKPQKEDLEGFSQEVNMLFKKAIKR